MPDGRARLGATETRVMETILAVLQTERVAGRTSPVPFGSPLPRRCKCRRGASWFCPVRRLLGIAANAILHSRSKRRLQAGRIYRLAPGVMREGRPRLGVRGRQRGARRQGVMETSLHASERSVSRARHHRCLSAPRYPAGARAGASWFCSSVTWLSDSEEYER